MMKQAFKEYLVKTGYKEYTPSGNPSTAYDYPNRIENVCKWENINWSELALKINFFIEQYDKGGQKEKLGNRSNRAVINALKRFAEFLVHRNKTHSSA